MKRIKYERLIVVVEMIIVWTENVLIKSDL